MPERPAKPFTTDVNGSVTVVDERIADVAVAIARCRDVSESAAKGVLGKALKPRVSAAFPLNIIKHASPKRFEEISKDILGACHVVTQYYLNETASDDTKIAGIVLNLITNEAWKYIKPLLGDKLIGDDGEVKITLALSDHTDLNSINLHISFASLLEQELRRNGWSEADAVNVAQAATSSLDLTSFRSRDQINAAVRLAAETAQATRASPNGAFAKVANPPLPTAAPAKWQDRGARLPNETPIEFLNRVWAPWLRARVLYQDDIKRLGDDKLVRAIRGFCQKHPEIKASEVLPPPRQARLERALADATPGSAAATLIKRKMRDREAIARRRASPKPR